MYLFPGFFPWVMGGPQDWFPHELQATLRFFDEYVNARTKAAKSGA